KSLNTLKTLQCAIPAMDPNSRNDNYRLYKLPPTSSVVTHRYDKPGIYNAFVVISNGSKVVDVADVSIEVLGNETEPPPPPSPPPPPPPTNPPPSTGLAGFGAQTPGGNGASYANT